MHKPQYKKFSLAVALSSAMLLPALTQAKLMIYPMKGQSSEQLSKDRYECHLWAVQQSGFDPTAAQAAQPAPQSQPQKGQVLRGGLRGAAAGAAIGAIAGDAGKEAAVGATAGGLKKGFERMDQQRVAQSQAPAPTLRVNAIKLRRNESYARCVGWISVAHPPARRASMPDALRPSTSSGQAYPAYSWP